MKLIPFVGALSLAISPSVNTLMSSQFSDVVLDKNLVKFDNKDGKSISFRGNYYVSMVSTNSYDVNNLKNYTYYPINNTNAFNNTRGNNEGANLFIFKLEMFGFNYRVDSLKWSYDGVAYEFFYDKVVFQYYNTALDRVYILSPETNETKYDLIFRNAYYDWQIVPNSKGYSVVNCYLTFSLDNIISVDNRKYTFVSVQQKNETIMPFYNFYDCKFSYYPNDTVIEYIDTRSFFFDFLATPFYFYSTLFDFEIFGIKINTILFSLLGVLLTIGIVKIAFSISKGH